MASEGREEGHVLVIEQQGIDYTILHRPDCPTAAWAEGLPGDGPVIVHTCGVGTMVGDVGLEFLDTPDEYGPEQGWETLPEGRYPLTFWWVRYPSTPNGPEEWDAGLEVGDREA